ncbi:MAG TPA: pilus assembly protein TadG-related protein [Candidatus Xenobia bacterium]|jgi:uncharacterized membrane protein
MNMKLDRSRRVSRSADERGATFIIVAISTVIFLAAGALSVDLGRTVVENRSLQSIADAGALDAARNYSQNPQTMAQNAAIDNGSSQAATPVHGYDGTWSQGTTAGAGSCNSSSNAWTLNGTPNPANSVFPAVMVVATSQMSALFEHSNSALSRCAIAAIIPPEAGFSIGTTLASISTQQSTLNALLGGLSTPPTTATVSVLGYQGLATTSVSLLDLINASGGALTPSNVLTAHISDLQLEQFMKKALGGLQPVTTDVTNALGGLTTLIPGSSSSTTLQLCQAISVNGSTCANPAVSTSALAASANVLQTLTYAAELANGTSGLDLGAGLVTGVADAKVFVTAIQPAQIGYGQPIFSVSTAQLTGTLQLTLLPILGLGLVTINVPLSAATGQATLASVTCPGNIPTVNLSPVTTGAANTSIDLDVLGAKLLSVPLTISGATAPAPLTFTPPFDASDAQSVGTTSPKVSIGTATGSILAPLTLLLATAVNPVLGLLSPVLAPLLQALGVSVADASVAVTAGSCGGAQLVQ